MVLYDTRFYALRFEHALHLILKVSKRELTFSTQILKEFLIRTTFPNLVITLYKSDTIVKLCFQWPL